MGISALLFPGLRLSAEELEDERISAEAVHARSIATDKFMALMAIRPGMTILDIGTGSGQFAYIFAERLAGTGKVYATDIDEGCIRYVKEEARRRGLDNLYPVLVKPEGIDEFYSQHKYDLVTFFHVPMPNKAAFLAGIRAYMAEDGRLAILHYRAPTLFSTEDFGDHFQELFGELSMEPAGSPFLKGLSDTTRQIVRKYNGGQPDDMMRKAIVEDFNRLLSDARFLGDFLDGQTVTKDAPFTPAGNYYKDVDFNPAEKYFAEAQLYVLREAGLFDRNPRKTNPNEIIYVERLNKLFFLQRFRKYLDAERLFVPILNAKTKDSFEQAGFRLEKAERALLSFEDLEVFRLAKSTKER